MRRGMSRSGGGKSVPAARSEGVGSGFAGSLRGANLDRGERRNGAGEARNWLDISRWNTAKSPPRQGVKCQARTLFSVKLPPKHAANSAAPSPVFVAECKCWEAILRVPWSPLCWRFTALSRCGSEQRADVQRARTPTTHSETSPAAGRGSLSADARNPPLRAVGKGRYLRKRAYFLRAAPVSAMPPIASTFASNSSVRGKTLSIGIRTGLILPERFEIAVCVRFEVVDGMVKCFV